MLKGMGIGAIIKLVLAIMIASLFISISTVGSLGQALSQSFEDIERVSGEKGIQIEDTETLSWAIALTRDRALNRGCEVVAEKNEDDGGYPGLEGSYLTKYPPCYGGEAGLIRGLEGINPGGIGVDENFMSGIYSREKIEITRNMSFQSDDIGVTSEDQDKLGGVFGGTPRSNAENVEFNNEDGDVNVAVTAAGGAAAGAILGPGGAIGGAIVGGVLGAAAGLFNNHQNEQPNVVRPMLFFEEGDVFERTSLNEGDGVEENPGNFDIHLCEGDEGYVQANRGDLDEFGKSSKSPLIPIIVIDEIQYESC